MLANSQNTSEVVGSLDHNVHKPGTFINELLVFIGDELPRWRDRPDRLPETAETILTSQLCAHLNGVARRSTGWDILQFRPEENDAKNKGRKLDLVAGPAGSTIWIDERRYTEFDPILPIECKRLPTPSGKGRDEREYVFSQYSSTGGIQRFKSGAHGSNHTRGAMIAYVQQESISHWTQNVCDWVQHLTTSQPGWTTDDIPQFEAEDTATRTGRLTSSHNRQKLPAILLQHLWVVMN